MGRRAAVRDGDAAHRLGPFLSRVKELRASLALLRARLAEPRDIPRDRAVMLMGHVEGCRCSSIPLEDSKIIDSRCIRGYRVPGLAAGAPEAGESGS
jgi:hypothetical protein